jgi:uncharacterized membrane protein
MNDGSLALGLSLALAGALIVLVTRQGTRGAAGLGLLCAALLVAGFGAGAIAPLALFVLGAGALTRLGRARKERLGAAESNRGRRDASHVLMKLGLPSALAAAALVRPEAAALLQLLAIAAIAGAFADTAATEIGSLAPGGAVRLRGARLVPARHGETGAVSAAGLAAAAGAALLLAGTARLTGVLASTADVPAAAVAGLLATLLESAVAGTRLGPAIGHAGRNLLVSAASVAFAWIASAAAPAVFAGGGR